MSAATATRIENQLKSRFSNLAAFAAAVNEVKTCQQFDSYLAGILAESTTSDVEAAVTAWAIRRGQIWE